MKDKEKFYITTAIAYTSRKPHIGNTYEVILTDAIARFKRKLGCDVFFLTGTDEHGQKIQQAAEEAGVTPKEYVDGVTGEIKKIWDLMGASYDHFIRTRRLSKRFSKSSTTRATSIRASTKGFTACRVSRFSRSRSLWTAAARTAGARSCRRKRKPTSSR